MMKYTLSVAVGFFNSIKKYKFIVYLIFIFLIAFGISFFWSRLKSRTDFIYKVTLADPLFYSPEIDVSKLREQTNNLLTSENQYNEELKKIITANRSKIPENEIEPLEKIISRGFLPNNYLKSLPNAIEKTDVFLKNPAPFNALLMLIASKNSASAYKKDARELDNVLVEIAKVPANPSFEMLASKTNLSTVLDDFRLISDNGASLEKEASARLNCFLWNSCSITVNERLVSENNFSLLEPDIKSFKLLPDEIVNMDDKNRSGPFFINSGCFPKKIVPMYLFHNENNVVAKQANEKYYYDIKTLLSKIKNNDNGNYTKLLSFLDVSFDNQPEGASYRCADLSYWGDLTTINYFQKKLNDPGINSWLDLNKLSTRFKNDKNFSDAEKNIIILENKIIDFPYMLGAISQDIDFGKSLLPLSNYILAEYLIGIRNPYSLTFNTFSKSVWRLNQKPRYFLEQNIQPDSIFKTYSDLSKIYSLEEIKKFYQINRDYIGQKKKIILHEF